MVDKSLTKEDNNLMKPIMTEWLNYLPLINKAWEKLKPMVLISLFVASLYQILRLTLFNGIQFFSWNQVLNDAVIIICYTSIYHGRVMLMTNKSIMSFIRQIGPKEIRFNPKHYTRVEVLLVVFICIMLVLSKTHLSAFVLRGLFVGLNATLKLYLTNDLEDIKKDLVRYSIIYSVFGSLLLPIFLDGYTVRIDNQESKIIYQNDQYIFTKDQIYDKNSGLLLNKIKRQ